MQESGKLRTKFRKLHFAEIAEQHVKASKRDWLELLKMKDPLPEKGLGNRYLPAIAPNRSCVWDNDQQCELLVLGEVAEHQSGAHFRCESEIHSPDLTWPCASHPPLL